jgi:endonuclease/exonuclease/phosphatase family metal-dependent hydrolase
MLKLISLNTEMERHWEKISALMLRESPDIVCLQETTQATVDLLSQYGLTYTFQPHHDRSIDDKDLQLGLAIGPRFPFTIKQFCYYQAREGEHNSALRGDMINNCCLHASIDTPNGNFDVVTTHFTWSPNGDMATPEQQADMRAVLKTLADYPPHVLCGDFNLARHHHALYAELTKNYTDAIPMEYQSSLDKNLHRCGNDPELQHLFTKYMVDYLFTQPPYQASAVRLEFDVSDHAAVIANITCPT